jgi:hypothetical protein
MPDFHTRPLTRFFPGISGEIRIGQMRPRWDRLGKNCRWYLVRRGFLRKVGWGDLAAADLAVLAEHLGGREAFVALRENPCGGQHLPHPAAEPRPGWCWYDMPDCGPVTTAELAGSATFVLINNAVLAVTTGVEPEVTVPAGYDLRGDGLVGAPRPYPTIHPDALEARLDDLVGPPSGDSSRSR